MKIEKQVCSLEQAKKFRELGITQESYCVYNPFNKEITESWTLNGDEEFYAAFTSAELGVMLGSQLFFPVFLTTADKKDYWLAPGAGKFETEAQARAAMLIMLLESKNLTAEEVNKKLLNVT